jgi:hypothetical protein
VGHDPAAAPGLIMRRVDHDPAAKWISTKPPLKPDPGRSEIREVRECPHTTYPRSSSFRGFEWLVMNVLNLDEKRVICERQEEPFIRSLEGWGFTPIPVAYRNSTCGGAASASRTLRDRTR